MDKIRQYQIITDIKPQYQKLTHPFHKTSMNKIKFLNKEYELQYTDIGVLESSENTNKSSNVSGGDFEPIDILVVSGMEF